MSLFDENGKAWMNGRLIPWKDANIHIASHVIHYGSSVFEGLRAYAMPKGTAVFRLEAHMRVAIGSGRRGSVTKRIQDEFFGILSGVKEDQHHWLTYI